jgi:aspartyl-tRNA(Asn)/glutamyl-tRNA(Gln) amidotransferase subunit A
MTVARASALLAKGETTATELAETCLSAIKERDTEVHAYLEVFDDVREQAREADERRKRGENITPLTGIPIAFKDNMLLEGRSVSAGSKILEEYVAPYTATALQKLKDAGVVFLGRTNQDEFAMGSSTEHSAYGPTKNPHDLARVPGGSSGGSAAAVAAGMALATLGSDTGGSIRQPASFCGVVGLKPTYGSVSRSGLIAMGSSLDVIGPFAHTVEDSALMFQAIKGLDPLDSTTIPVEQTSHEVKEKMKIGVPRAFLEGLDAEVSSSFEDSLKDLAASGHEIVDIELPYLKHSLAVYYVIMPAEASTNLARFDGVKYGLYKEGENRIDDVKKTRGAGFGTEVRRRILLGTYVLSSGYYDAYYGKATRVRAAIANDMAGAFTHVDAIATPTTPSPAFRIGEKSDPLSMYLADIFTVPANLSGHPALSVPGRPVTNDGKTLPIGIQLIAPHQREDTLFSLGRQIEIAL